MTVRLTIVPDTLNGGPSASTPATGTLTRNLYATTPTSAHYSNPSTHTTTNYAGYGSFQPVSVVFFDA